MIEDVFYFHNIKIVHIFLILQIEHLPHIHRCLTMEVKLVMVWFRPGFYGLVFFWTKLVWGEMGWGAWWVCWVWISTWNGLVWIDLGLTSVVPILYHGVVNGQKSCILPMLEWVHFDLGLSSVTPAIVAIADGKAKSMAHRSNCLWWPAWSGM
jgi:hypothetical protein